MFTERIFHFPFFSRPSGGLLGRAGPKCWDSVGFPGIWPNVDKCESHDPYGHAGSKEHQKRPYPRQTPIPGNVVSSSYGHFEFAETDIFCDVPFSDFRSGRSRVRFPADPDFRPKKVKNLNFKKNPQGFPIVRFDHLGTKQVHWTPANTFFTIFSPSCVFSLSPRRPGDGLPAGPAAPGRDFPKF